MLLCSMGGAVLADDGQLSRWEDSKHLDYPPPPVGGWEPMVPIYNPDEASNDAVSDNDQTANTKAQSYTAPSPLQYAQPAGSAYPMQPPGQSYAVQAAPAWPPVATPGYNRGYIRPGYKPGINRPAYAAPGYGPGFNRGYPMPGYTAPSAVGVPGNYGNPWNSGIPGGWAATPWGELGPAGWTYPKNATTTNPANVVPDAPNNTDAMSSGFNAPTASESTPSDAADHAKSTPEQVRGFSWDVR